MDAIVAKALRNQRETTRAEAAAYIRTVAEGVGIAPSVGVLQGVANTVLSYITTIDKITELLKEDK